MAKSYIGTSGWAYDAWKDDFYAGVPKKDWLRFAAGRFTGLEINATFYGQKPRATFERWREETPPAFGFTVKANRYLTHNKKLRDPEEPLVRERERALGLGPKLKAVLWQLPGNFHRDDARLARFLEALGAWPVAHALEFRHRSWFAGDVEDALRRHEVAVALSDAADWPMWDAVTAPFVYVRLHGHTRTYASSYSTASLRDWAERCRHWLSEGRDVHVYFDNDREGAAPRDALRLRAMVEPG